MVSDNFLNTHAGISFYIHVGFVDVDFCSRNNSDSDLIIEKSLVPGILECFRKTDYQKFNSYCIPDSIGTHVNPHLVAHVTTLHNVDITSSLEDKQELDPELRKLINIDGTPEPLRSRFLKLLNRYRDIFDWHIDSMGKITISSHGTRLQPGSVPKKVRPYRLSPQESESLKKELYKMLKLGIISETKYSDWASPIIMIPKKDKSYRLVVDYRYLNSCTVRLSQNLPRIDDLIDTLGKANSFSQVDMRAGFHQMPLDQSSRHLTNFVRKFGSYSYNRLPMGLVNAPSDFMKMAEICFHSLLNKCVIAYLDDVTTYTSTTAEDHLEAIAKTFECCEKGGLKLNPSKCSFFADKINFLGYVITSKGVEQSTTITDKITLYPVPTLK